jgi:co-chaperonin GroES (HSP10)
MPLRPIGKKVLIEPHLVRESEGGIIFPDSAVATNRGTVIGVSEKYGKDYEWPNIGDKVWFRYQFGQELTLNGQDMFLVDIQDVLGVLT